VTQAGLLHNALITLLETVTSIFRWDFDNGHGPLSK